MTSADPPEEARNIQCSFVLLQLPTAPLGCIILINEHLAPKYAVSQ